MTGNAQVKMPTVGERTRLRHRLETQRRELTAELHRRVARIRDSGSGTTRVSDTDEGDPWALDLQLAEIASASLRGVEAALDRFRDGQYGRCHHCRGEISVQRLGAMPFAVCCQTCEVARERETNAVRPARRRLWAEGYVSLDRA
jgi:DnaK suppressor protein